MVISGHRKWVRTSANVCLILKFCNVILNGVIVAKIIQYMEWKPPYVFLFTGIPIKRVFSDIRFCRFLWNSNESFLDVEWVTGYNGLLSIVIIVVFWYIDYFRWCYFSSLIILQCSYNYDQIKILVLFHALIPDKINIMQ